jgi:hypothetical protein
VNRFNSRGRYTDSVVLPTSPLERIREGMPVADVSGRSLGRVARVQLPPPPVTHPPDSDILDDMANLVPAPPEMSEASAEFDVLGTSPVGHDPAALPELPEQVREHLEAQGFIEVDGPNLTGPERYVPADRVAEVTQNQVTIRPR